MPRIKMARKSTLVDMTAMTDVAFLLLTFFMLATKFKPSEPVAVVTPSSINTTTLPDANVILLTIDKKGRVFFDMPGQSYRQELIQDVNKNFKLKLSGTEMKSFALGASVGTDMKNLKSYLAMKPDARKDASIETGIPTDSASNELGIWLKYAYAVVDQHKSTKKLKFCIKADNATPYPKIKAVLEIFKKENIFHLNLVTNLEAAPEV
ncbi:biopolymer transport protein ExbD/TolR [Chitinophaga niastensis]|uniref:Biopolymer transport protein ExbD/TolR n=1 Tax=Chitinophaga niastensis TaxID=536980 RepID=A0A2P8HDP0_CHINA|nr:biopolymer transporter ExbD [Chitinophaga niastensis]PSL44344.1 biopolymer transport protein ExbD/TolR [Chitinophaga niastensis]